MFDKITYISDDSCNVKLKEDVEITMNLIDIEILQNNVHMISRHLS